MKVLQSSPDAPKSIESVRLEKDSIYINGKQITGELGKKCMQVFQENSADTHPTENVTIEIKYD